MEQQQQCACQAAPKLIFPCSGASDLGELSDRAARRLTKLGSGKMFCLAGIGGRVATILESTQSASLILAIDGCSSDCAKNTLELAGFKGVYHLRLTDLGYERGKAPPTSDRISQVVQKAQAILESKSQEEPK